ncbi:hypothetical protein J4455_03370 [Candidatus Woesearchaeota archaeon]|nr:hypothetical protein [Candidatus Woesearchaeota archaeon]
MDFNIFKLEYYWYEGEHEETLLGKNIERVKFEKDLVEAKNFAKSLIGKEHKENDYLGKGYSVECLPEYYKQIIWFLIEKKGYTECYFDEDTSYSIDDLTNGKEIQIKKYEKKIKISEL